MVAKVGRHIKTVGEFRRLVRERRRGQVGEGRRVGRRDEQIVGRDSADVGSGTRRGAHTKVVRWDSRGRVSSGGSTLKTRELSKTGKSV